MRITDFLKYYFYTFMAVAYASTYAGGKKLFWKDYYFSKKERFFVKICKDLNGKNAYDVGTGWIMQDKKEKVDDIISICVISTILVLLLIITATGSM